MDKPSMFEQSRSLIAGAKIIINCDGVCDNGNIMIPTSPVIILCAIAIEICLKLLIINETGKEVQQVHDLKSLFERIPKDLSSRVVEHFLEKNKEETLETLTENIAIHKNIFVDWRYAYEKFNLECSPSFLYSFAFCLNAYIEDNYKFERNQNGWLKVGNI